MSKKIKVIAITATVFIIVTIMGGALTLAFREAVQDARAMRERGIHSNVILNTDSCGCKVFIVEVDGHKILVNNQGGLIELKP